MLTERRLTLWALTWPVFIEMFLQFLLGTADTLMVSHISDDAVAVVGISNQLFSAVTILFMTVAGGAGVLIAQKLGAHKADDARKIGIMAVNISIAIGLVLSLLLYACAGSIAKLLQLSVNLQPLAISYISIVGGGMVLTAAMSTFSTVIRNTGNTRGPMFIAIGMNVIHITLNYCLIYGALGLPQLGLEGAAISTLISRLIASLVLFALFVNSFERRVAWKDIRLFDNSLFKEMLRVGWPMGVNMASWVMSQLIIFSFLAMLGTKELAARTYMNSMESFCFLLGYSVALAVQIQIAHLFGAGRMKEAYRSAYRALWVGLALVTLNALLLYVVGAPVLRVFTSDPQIVTIGVSLLALNLLLQPGKMLNMALGNALTATGDTRYVMMTSLVSMWLVATGGSYFLGIHLEWGVVGIYLAMIADEYLRGIAVLFRWIGQKSLRASKQSDQHVDMLTQPAQTAHM
jgi:putative MATE family efflux protein